MNIFAPDALKKVFPLVCIFLDNWFKIASNFFDFFKVFIGHPKFLSITSTSWLNCLIGNWVVDNLSWLASVHSPESSNTSAKLFLKLGNVSRESLTRSVAPQWFSPSRYSRMGCLRTSAWVNVPAIPVTDFLILSIPVCQTLDLLNQIFKVQPCPVAWWQYLRTMLRSRGHIALIVE